MFSFNYNSYYRRAAEKETQAHKFALVMSNEFYFLRLVWNKLITNRYIYPRRFVAFSVVMIFIIYVSNISYLFQCRPWLAITVSLILPVYKINEFNTNCWVIRTYTEPWVLARD